MIYNHTCELVEFFMRFFVVDGWSYFEASDFKMITHFTDLFSRWEKKRKFIEMGFIHTLKSIVFS